MKILCINIDSDTESWALAQKEFDRVGLTVERMPAIVGDNRPLAFNQSVYKAMLRCKTSLTLLNEPQPDGSILRKQVENIYEDLLLFEDDVVFDSLPSGLTTRIHFNGGVGSDVLFDTGKGWLQEVACNFLTLHLGCNIIGMDTTVWQMPTPHSKHLAKLHNCWQSHATLYSAECVKFILDNLDPSYLGEDNNIFDDWLRRKVLSQGRSYVMKPMIAYQRPRQSAIWNTHADYTSCHTRGNQYLATL